MCIGEAWLNKNIFDNALHLLLQALIIYRNDRNSDVKSDHSKVLVAINNIIGSRKTKKTWNEILTCEPNIEGSKFYICVLYNSPRKSLYMGKWRLCKCTGDHTTYHGTIICGELNLHPIVETLQSAKTEWTTSLELVWKPIFLTNSELQNNIKTFVQCVTPPQTYRLC